MVDYYKYKSTNAPLSLKALTKFRTSMCAKPTHYVHEPFPVYFFSCFSLSFHCLQIPVHLYCLVMQFPKLHNTPALSSHRNRRVSATLETGVISGDDEEEKEEWDANKRDRDYECERPDEASMGIHTYEDFAAGSFEAIFGFKMD
jgi:hypothetical protein